MLRIGGILAACAALAWAGCGQSGKSGQSGQAGQSGQSTDACAAPQGKITAVAGVATLSNVSITKSGTGYGLVASASGLTSAPATNGFDVSSAAASKLGIALQPSTSVANGGTLAQQPVVELREVRSTTWWRPPALSSPPPSRLAVAPWAGPPPRPRSPAWPPSPTSR